MVAAPSSAFGVRERSTFGPAAPAQPAAVIPGANAERHTPNAEVPGDPRDYESLWYAPLRTWGVNACTLAAYDVQITYRPDERKPHPGQSPRLWWRYPLWEDDGAPLTWRMAAVDGEYPRSRWDGLERPDLIYEPVGIIRGQPLIICGDVLSVWVLHSLDIAACCFVCRPSDEVPPHALAQIAGAAPSSVLVVDNERPCLPGGARAVASALRGWGVPAGYARLRVPTSPLGLLDGCMSHLVASCGGDQGRVWQALGALVGERRT